MKFLCPSCKAKYQIADEKVAGRSVRMKCRKCGYVIQVSSVAGMGDALPGSEPPPADSSVDASASAAVELSAPAHEVSAPAAAPAPIESLASGASNEPPAVAAATNVPAVAAAAKPPAPKPAVPVRPATPAPRPTFGTGARPAVPAAGAPAAPKAPPAKSTPLNKPAVPASATAPSPAAPPVRAGTAGTVAASPTALGLKSDKRTMQGGTTAPLPPVATKSKLPEVIAAPIAVAPAASGLPSLGSLPLVRDFDEEEESTRIADASALAGAFSLAVGGASSADAKAGETAMPADEWFVGINGVPVGPIRLSELRSKAASGSVSRDSLVWRDGFEEWRPLKSFPELVAIVDESVSSARASLTPFTPAVSSVTGPTPGVSAPAILPAAGAPPPAAVAVSDPFSGATVSGSGVTGAAVVTDDIEVAGVPRRSGFSAAAWIALAVAILFGMTISFVFFSRTQPPKEVIRYVDRPVPGASSAAAAPTGQTSTPDEATAAADPKNPAKHVAGTGTTKTAASSTPTAAEPDKGISGLKNLSGLSTTGPSRGPDGTTGPSGTVGGTGQLDGAQIQSTVARYTSSVKRACWQPALDTRDKDAPTTARVNVTITVLPSGSVSNATTGGDPRGYRGLSQCISSRVRGWTFPPSGDTTTVNVPFVFAAQ